MGAAREAADFLVPADLAAEDFFAADIAPSSARKCLIGVRKLQRGARRGRTRTEFVARKGGGGWWWYGMKRGCSDSEARPTDSTNCNRVSRETQSQEHGSGPWPRALQPSGRSRGKSRGPFQRLPRFLGRKKEEDVGDVEFRGCCGCKRATDLACG